MYNVKNFEFSVSLHISITDSNVEHNSNMTYLLYYGCMLFHSFKISLISLRENPARSNIE